MIEYKKAQPVTIGHLSFNSKAKAKVDADINTNE